MPQFINLVIQQLEKLAADSFTAKCQSNYLRECKKNLEENEVIILADFANIIVLLCKMRCKDFTGITFSAPFTLW